MRAEVSKILLVISEVFRRNGGIQQYNRLLCKAASDYAKARGVRVHILSCNDRTMDATDSYVQGSGVSFQGFDGDSRRFVIGVLRTAMQVRPDITFFNLAQRYLDTCETVGDMDI